MLEEAVMAPNPPDKPAGGIKPLPPELEEQLDCAPPELDDALDSAPFGNANTSLILSTLGPTAEVCDFAS